MTNLASVNGHRNGYAKFAAQRDLELMTRWGSDPDSLTAAEISALVGDNVVAFPAPANGHARKAAQAAVHVTFFQDHTSQSKREAKMSLIELRDKIQNTTKPTKGELPWLKLAVFGNKRTGKNSLRSNANYEAISGIELDYDEKKVSFEDAIDIVTKAKLMCLAYTSARYKPEEPKWRLLLPTSKLITEKRDGLSDAEWDELMTATRAKLVARVNGLFGGIFDGASFTLSQAYYYGGIGNNPTHQAVVIEGEYIDLRDDLDAGALGKGEKKETASADPYADESVWRKFADKQTKKSIDVDQMLADMECGHKYHSIHHTQLSVIAALLCRGVTADEAIERVLKRTMEVTKIPSEKTRKTQIEKLQGMVNDWLNKHPEFEKTAFPEVDNNVIDLKKKLLQSTAEFLEGYVPPDYLVDGLLQRRYVYSLTAPTGSGKTAIALRIAFHVAFGLELAGREVEKGRVLFFAGENPDDIRSRWLMLCEKMGYEWQDVDVFFMPFTLDLEKFREQIDDESAKHGPFSLLIVDTSASYYTGDEENQNVQLGNHARMLRTFVDLPGGPTILVTCHPTKTPNMENLLPRGGGAFIAEVDGNLVCLKTAGSMVVEITWHGKFRGPDFKSFAFKLVPGQSDKLVDTKGRYVWSITAEPISDAEQEELEKAGTRNQDDLLRTMLDHPGLSLVQLAEKLGWVTKDTKEPNKSYVWRMLKDLAKEKLVEKERGSYVLTNKGEKAAEQLPKVKYIEVVPLSEEEKKAKNTTQ